MAYTVGEMAKRLGVPASTLRYYDKEGLLPFVGRSSGGIRVFEEKDFEWLRIIECLKKTGMSLKDIREYIELAMQGDATIAQRLEMFRKQKAVLEARMAELQQTMDTLDYKCWFYETAKARGSDRWHQRFAGRQTAREPAPGARAPAGSGGMKADQNDPTGESTPLAALRDKGCTDNCDSSIHAFFEGHCAVYYNTPEKIPPRTPYLVARRQPKRQSTAKIP